MEVLRANRELWRADFPQAAPALDTVLEEGEPDEPFIDIINIEDKGIAKVNK